MRVLVLATTLREPDNQLLWKGLAEYADVELVRLNKDEQRNLAMVFRRFDLQQYDCVVLDVLFRHLSRQAHVLSNIPRLVVYEEDACQEFLPASKWYGKFSTFYKKIPHARLIFTGHSIAQRFKAKGVDARFLPKGYDSARLADRQQNRDIELGFIGRISSDAYRGRRAFLERACQRYALRVMRTAPGEEYCQALNRIKIFVSADVGLGEYMAKNFEAMACGCVLIACRQGAGEEEALGLVDGENAVLYDGYDEFCRKLDHVLANPDLLKEIALRGKAFAQDNFDYLGQGRRLVALLQEPYRSYEHSGAGFVFKRWIKSLIAL